MITRHTITTASCLLLGIAIAGSLLLAQAPASPRAQGGRGGAGGGGAQQPPFGVVAYPPRPAGDPAAIERGKSLYGVNCTFCHGGDMRGGDGGPSLLRSTTVLDDQRGELVAPIIEGGRGAMPKFLLTRAQIADIAEFLHSFPVSSRSTPSTINILVGDARKGAAFVAAKCASCHTSAALSAFAAKLDDPIELQQMWLMPGRSGGRGGGRSPIQSPPITVTVTLPSGEKVEGTLERVDDFIVSLTQADGRRRSFRTIGTATSVELHDPLQPHRDLLRTYTDSDIHNVTAYLASLRQR